MSRSAGRRLGLPLDPDEQLTLIRAVLRRLLAHRVRQQLGPTAATGTAGVRAGATVVRLALARCGDLALKVQAHLHLHELGRALDQVVAGLLVVAARVHGRRVGGAAQLPGPAALALRGRQGRAEEWVARHVMVPVARERLRWIRDGFFFSCNKITIDGINCMFLLALRRFALDRDGWTLSAKLWTKQWNGRVLDCTIRARTGYYTVCFER